MYNLYIVPEIEVKSMIDEMVATLDGLIAALDLKNLDTWAKAKLFAAIVLIIVVGGILQLALFVIIPVLLAVLAIVGALCLLGIRLYQDIRGAIDGRHAHAADYGEHGNFHTQMRALGRAAAISRTVSA
jgi:phage-related minor tail protein